MSLAGLHTRAGRNSSRRPVRCRSGSSSFGSARVPCMSTPTTCTGSEGNANGSLVYSAAPSSSTRPPSRSTQRATSRSEAGALTSAPSSMSCWPPMTVNVRNTKVRREIGSGIRAVLLCEHYIVTRERAFPGGPCFLESAKLETVRVWLFKLPFDKGFWPLARCLSAMVLLAAAPVSYGTPQQESVAAQEHAERARQSIGRGELKTAEAELRQAVELAPQDGEYLGLLGIVLGMQQKLQESDIYLEKALRLDPGDSASRRNLGWNQFQLGQLQPAKANLERVLKEKPHDVSATLVLGMVHEELRDYRTALQLLESVPDQVRERPESMAALARSYYYTGRAQKAREALKELQLHPAKPEEMFLA